MMSENDNVFFDPFICYMDRKEVVNGVSLFKVSVIMGDDKCFLDPEEEWYCRSFSGIEIQTFLATDLKRMLEGPSCSNMSVHMINQAVQLFSKSFVIDPSMMKTLTSTCYSYLVIGKRTEESFKVHSATMYHHNPTLGTFIPYLSVDADSKRKGLGSTMLMVLQKLFDKALKNPRLLVWLYLPSIHEHNALLTDKDKAEIRKSLIRFYRRLGFHPTIPSLYSLAYVVTQALQEEIREVQNSSFLLEVKKKMKMDRPILTIPTKQFTATKKGAKKKQYHLVKAAYLKAQKTKCMVCLASVCTDSKEGFVFCTAECTNGKTRLAITSNKKNTRTKSVTMKSICGVTLCLTCMSNFGLDCNIPRCPLHADDERDTSKITEKALKIHVAAEYEKVKKCLLNKISKSYYFNGTFEYCDNKVVNKSTCTCKLCRTNIEITRLHGGKDKVKEDDLLVFAQHYKLKPTKLLALVQRENSLIEVQKLKDIESFPISPCSYYSNDSNYNPQRHNLAFDGNIGSGASYFQNQIFGIKPIYGKGDCGFLCLWIGIMSGEKSQREKYIKCLVNYVKEKYKECRNLFHCSGSQRANKRQKVEDTFTISLVRKALFLSIFDLSILSAYKKTEDMEDVDNKKTFLEESYFSLQMQLHGAFGCDKLEEIDKNDNVIETNRKKLQQKAMDERITCIEELCAFNDRSVEQDKNADVDYLYFFESLMDIYSQDNTTNGSDVVWMDSATALKGFSLIFNYEIGLIVLIENIVRKFHDKDHEFYIEDNGYFMQTNKPLFEKAKHFIFLRFSDGQHYDLFYDIYNAKAIYSTQPTKKEGKEILSPAVVVGKYSSRSAYNLLFGKERHINERKYSNMFKGFLPPSLSSQVRYSPQDYRMTIREKTKNLTFKDIKNCDSLQHLNRFTQWFEECMNMKSFHKSDADKPSAQQLLQSVTDGSFVPIIISPYHILENDSFLFLSGFIKIYEPLDSNSSTTPQANVHFELVDCNKLPFTKLHMEKCPGLKKFFEITKTMIFTYQELAILYSTRMWTIPTETDVVYCWKRLAILYCFLIEEDGNLYNKLFSRFGFSDNMSEMTNMNYMAECLFVLSKRASKREIKQKYHLMLQGVTHQLSKQEVSSDNKERVRKHLQHFFIFGEFFRTTGDIEGLDEISTQFLDNFFPKHKYDLLRNNLDHFIHKQNDDNDDKKVQDHIYSNEEWSMKLMEYLWIPLKVFHVETDFHVLKYLCLLDIMVYEYSDEYMENLDLGNEQKICTKFFTDKKFLDTTVTQLFSVMLSSVNVPLVDSIFKGIEKYVLNNNTNRTSKTLVEITPRHVHQELNHLKISIQYYMGYGDLSDSELMNKYLETAHKTKEITPPPIDFKLKHEKIDVHFNSDKNRDRISKINIVDIIEDGKEANIREQTENEIKKASIIDDEKKAKEEVLKILLQRVEMWIRSMLNNNQTSKTNNTSEIFVNEEFMKNSSIIHLPKHESNHTFQWKNNMNDSDKCIQVMSETISYKDTREIFSQKAWLYDNVINAMITVFMNECEHKYRNSSSTTDKEFFKVCSLTSIFYSRILIQDYHAAWNLLNRADYIETTDNTTEKSIFMKYNLFLFPINLKNHHWKIICLDTKNNRFINVDPIKTEGISNDKMEENDIKICAKIITLFYMYDYNSRSVLDKMLKSMIPCDACNILPKQTDSSSCGVFVIMITFSILKYQCIGKIHSQEYTELFRKYIFYTLSHFHTCVNKDMIQNHMKKEGYKSLFFDEKENGMSSIDLITNELEIPVIELNQTATTDQKDHLKELQTKTIQHETKILDKDIINVDTQEDSKHLVSNDESSTVVSTSSSRGKTIKLGELQHKINSRKKKRKTVKTTKQRKIPKKNNDTDIDDQLERLWYTANARYICNTTSDNRILLSFSKIGNNRKTNHEIEMKEQYFDLLKDFCNNEKNTKLKSYISNLKKDTWTSLTGSETGKQLQTSINKYYTELRKDHARDHKPYSHIRYVQKINGYEFIIYDKINKIIVQDTLSNQYIDRVGLQNHAKEAKSNPGRIVALTSCSKRQNKQQNTNNNFPSITFQQGKKQVCFQYALLSALKYLRSYNIKKSRNGVPKCLHQDIIDMLQKETKTLVGTALIRTTNTIMRNFGWKVILYTTIQNECKAIMDAFKSPSTNKDIIIMAHLHNEYGITNHYIAMTQNMICDSNFSRFMELNYNNLNLSCGSDDQNRTFCNFDNVIKYEQL